MNCLAQAHQVGELTSALVRALVLGGHVTKH